LSTVLVQIVTQSIRVSVTLRLGILEHPPLLGSGTIMSATISTKIATGVSTIEGMMLGKPMRLYGDLVTTGQAMLTGDLQLSGDSVVILEAPPAVQVLREFICHVVLPYG
jgi:hypothetical protein